MSAPDAPQRQRRDWMRALIPAGMARSGWTGWHVLALVILAEAAFAVTFDAWSDMFRIAGCDEESSHILLVPIVAFWLFWVRRGRLRQCPPNASLAGPALVAFGWLLHSVGDLYLVQAFWHLGAVLILVGAFVSIAGKDIVVRFLPAFVVLGFLVPVPGTIRQEIAIPLQTATAGVAQTLLETLGVPISRAGNLLTINGQDVAIAEACNGLRMVFALVLVTYAFAYGTPLRSGARLLVIALSPIFAVAANVLRLAPTVWMYGYYPTETADRVHDISGWVMLPVAFFSLLGILRVLRWSHIPVTRYVLAYGS